MEAGDWRVGAGASQDSREEGKGGEACFCLTWRQ